MSQAIYDAIEYEVWRTIKHWDKKPNGTVHTVWLKNYELMVQVTVNLIEQMVRIHIFHDNDLYRNFSQEVSTLAIGSYHWNAYDAERDYKNTISEATYFSLQQIKKTLNQGQVHQII